MLYDVNTHIKTQITNSINDSYRPVTDGNKIIWFENTAGGNIMWYYNIESGNAHKVAYINPPVARWLWLSNGKVAWSSNGEICIYDGNVISQLTSSAPFNPNLEPFIDNDVVVWNKNNPDPNTNHYGQIFRGKLHAHVSFDADNIAGYNPFTVSFKNNSFQGVQSYLWDFGDGQISTEKNPVHIYQTQGIYSVTLTVNGPSGSSSEKKINLIRVNQSTSVNESAYLRPQEFKLYQNYPNPFNPSTVISWQLPVGSKVSLKVYDVLGREALSLVNEEKPAGEYELTFNASQLSSGIYFYQLNAGRFTDSKAMILIK